MTSVLLANLETIQEELKYKIIQYELVIDIFGLTKDNKVQYDETKDEFFKTYLKSGDPSPFSDAITFFDYVDYKTIDELKTELSETNEKIAKLRSIKSPSDEQYAIVNLVGKNTNIIVDAVAGSGKTTTVLFIASKFADKKILQITYNSELKIEVRKKVQEMEIKNLEIHSYHSLAVKYYDHKAHTDDNIIKLLDNNTSLKKSATFDIVIIDEAQDMTMNYFSLINKFLCDTDCIKANLLVLGDKYQGIYEFKNADTRFLTLSKNIWTKTFTNLPLQTSYRVSKQIAWFVNHVMLGQDRIISKKNSDHKVYYYKQNKFAIHSQLFAFIKKLLANGKKADNFFILAPSVRTNESLKKLEHLLVSNGIPTYFARNDEEGLDENKTKNKIVFTTFHQSKGREREVVIVFDFDDSYFEYTAVDKNKYVCPSELYVAATRASDILVLIEHSMSQPLSFLKMTHDEMKKNPMIEFIGDHNKYSSSKKTDKIKEKIHKTSVSELTRYLSDTTLENLVYLVDPLFKVLKDPNPELTSELPTSMKSDKNLVEDISDLVGIVIPTMWEAKKNKRTSIENIIKLCAKSLHPDDDKFVLDACAKIASMKTKTIADYLYIGNVYIAVTENIHSKLAQIDKYDWLTQEVVDKCHKNMENNVSKNVKYELELGDEYDGVQMCYKYQTNSYGTIYIRGRIDAIDESTVWEFKCVNMLTMEHKLQVIMYAWIWRKCMKDVLGGRQFKILNIRTGQILELNTSSYVIDQIVDILLDNKYDRKEKDDDPEFIEKCNNAIINIRENKGKEKKRVTRSMFDFMK